MHIGSHMFALMRADNGIKPFECKVCGKCFAWRQDLLVHEKLHKGFTSFRCGECGDHFNGLAYLTRHKKT